MEQDSVKKSIQIFENKKEFRAVKLTTKKSFREDQAALDKRLTKYRNSLERSMSSADAVDVDRQVNEHDNDSDVDKNVVKDNAQDEGFEESSKLENIVLDVGDDQKEKTETDPASEEMDGERRKSLDESVSSSGLGTEVSEKSPDSHTHGDTLAQKEHVNGTEKKIHTSENRSQTTSHQPLQTTLSGTRLQNGALLNGRAPHQASLVTRPRVNGQISGQFNGSISPDPTIKLLKGIYQKNPKLTAGSTDHLDNISLKSFRSGPRSQDVRQYAGPIVPSAEVTSLPADGNLLQFSVPQMVTIFRLLHLPGELIYKLSKCNVDGRRFAMFSDKELDDLGMNNPIIRYFRDRSAQRPVRRKKKLFIL